jgi:hypothetical protein
VHRSFGGPLLIRRARILLRHFECAPSEHSQELMRGLTVVCCDRRPSLPQATSGDTARPIVSVAELVAEASFAQSGNQLSLWNCLVGVAGFEPATPSSRTRGHITSLCFPSASPSSGRVCNAGHWNRNSNPANNLSGTAGWARTTDLLIHIRNTCFGALSRLLLS